METRAALAVVLNESLLNVPEELVREAERAHMMLEDYMTLPDLDDQVEALSGEVAMAEARMEFHNDRANGLERAAVTQQAEIDRLRELNGTLDNTIANQRKLIETLNATVETMGVGRDALERTIAALETRIRLRDHTIAESAAHFMRLLNTVRDKDDLIDQGFQELKAMSQENHLLKGEVEQRDGYITDCLNLLAEKRRAIRRLTKDSRAAARMNRRIMQARFHKYEAMKVRKGRAVLIKFNMKRMGLA